ncbi:MAG: PHP domain-containing protein [Chloroflexi bacterium]|nr:PHP domain-containing protein [Chloroflexota bacterium]
MMHTENKSNSIDLHVHAMERSSCAVSGEEDMIQAAIRRGLGSLVFTDHDHLVSPQRIAELRKKYAPFRVFGGIEIKVSGEDILVLGVHDLTLEVRIWTYPELYGFVQQRGGFIALAHPFRFHNTINVDIETYRPDGIEIRSTNIRPKHQARIRALAERLGLPLLCNSDAHREKDVGAYYNVLPHAPRDEQDLIYMLKAGKHQCGSMKRCKAIPNAG